jgi:hypothetical protein
MRFRKRDLANGITMRRRLGSGQPLGSLMAAGGEMISSVFEGFNGELITEQLICSLKAFW